MNNEIIKLNKIIGIISVNKAIDWLKSVIKISLIAIFFS